MPARKKSRRPIVDLFMGSPVTVFLSCYLSYTHGDRVHFLSADVKPEKVQEGEGAKGGDYALPVLVNPDPVYFQADWIFEPGWISACGSADCLIDEDVMRLAECVILA